jgi:hypothetical protein
MKNFTKILAILCSILILAGCSKDMVNTPAKSIVQVKQLNSSGPLAVSSVSPSVGIIFTAVTITGNNFSSVPSENIVKFNGVSALVNSATSSQLVVTVPYKATTGKISVTTGGITDSTATDFQILNLKETGSISPTINGFYTQDIAFDKSGLPYISFTSETNGHQGDVLAKYNNGLANVIYRAPRDTSIYNTDGSGTLYYYVLRHIVIDSKNNVFADLSTIVIDSNSTGEYYYQTTSAILKITSSGQASTLVSTINSNPIGEIDGMTIDPSDNIYIIDQGLESPNSTAHSIIEKVTPEGSINIFYTDNYSGRVDGIESIKSDTYGNLFVGFIRSVIMEISSQGNVLTTYSPPSITGQAVNSMCFDRFGNLICITPTYIFLLNQAGYIIAVNPKTQFNPGGIFSNYSGNTKLITDNVGNIYSVNIYVVNAPITRFDYQ